MGDLLQSGIEALFEHTGIQCDRSFVEERVVGATRKHSRANWLLRIICVKCEEPQEVSKLGKAAEFLDRGALCKSCYFQKVCGMMISTRPALGCMIWRLI